MAGGDVGESRLFFFFFLLHFQEVDAARGTDLKLPEEASEILPRALHAVER